MKIKQLLLIFSFLTLSLTCHYSCQTCALDYYNYCLTCSSSFTFQVLQDPSQINESHINNNQKTGVCTGKIDTSVNAFGVCLVVLAILGLCICRGSKYFYLLYTLQTFALLTFLQIAWVSPLSYVMNGLQYLMVFNKLGQSLKETSWEIKQQSFYRLDRYYHESSLLKSLAILGIFNAIIFCILAIFFIFRQIQKNCYDKKYQYSPTVKKIQQIFQIAFFFTIQETVLSIVVSLYFSSSIDASAIAITAVYAVLYIFFIGITLNQKITLFPNKLVQFMNIMKKAIYPIFIIIPQSFQYALIIFMLVDLLFELVYDRLDSLYPFKSRVMVYKFLQITILILSGVCFIVERSVNEMVSLLIIQYFLMVFLYFHILALIIEGILKTKENFQKPNTTKVNPQESQAKIKPSQSQKSGKVQLTEENLTSDVQVIKLQKVSKKHQNSKSTNIQPTIEEADEEADEEEREREQERKKKKKKPKKLKPLQIKQKNENEFIVQLQKIYGVRD